MIRPSKLLGHLAAVEAGPLLERAGHAGKYQVSSADVKQSARSCGRSTHVSSGRRPAGWRGRRRRRSCRAEGMRFSSSLAAKRELLRIFDKIKQVGVRAAELVFAIHAERVIPDHPAAQMEADLLAGDLQLGGILIADRQPERARRLERAMHRRDPVRDQARYS